jgi:hypothetical protein
LRQSPTCPRNPTIPIRIRNLKKVEECKSRRVKEPDAELRSG